MNRENAFEKDYASIVESETVMFDDLGKFLVDNDIEGNAAQDIMLCVSEAFNNAVLHGNRLDTSKRVRLRLSANMIAITADVTDEGQSAIALIEKRKRPAPLDEGGRGINLMYERADEVILSTATNGGLSLRLVFKREKTKRNISNDIEVSVSKRRASKLQEES
ncbi:ATP-binding protein [bacterium AH-315-J21]|nr:ATP-binding protein [bacterium AH-315-J21]